MLYGGLVTFAGWMLYGLVAPKFLVREAPPEEMLVDADPTPPVKPAAPEVIHA